MRNYSWIPCWIHFLTALSLHHPTLILNRAYYRPYLCVRVETVVDRTPVKYTVTRGRSFKFPSPDFHQCPILARRIPLHLHFCDFRETAAQTRQTVMRQAVVESGLCGGPPPEKS